MADTFREGRDVLAECPRCHGSGNIVLGDGGVDETIRLYLSGLKPREVAEIQGVTCRTVRNRLDKAGIPRRPAGHTGPAAA